jgi:hypothetical protein
VSKKLTALLVIVPLVAASSGCGDAEPRGGPSKGRDPVPPSWTDATRTSEAAERPRPEGERPTVRLAATPGLRLSQARLAAAVLAAQDFAVSLTRWLYGERKSIDVGPLSPAVRRELASSPPYVPPDERGTGAGHVQQLELALQTERSGIVTVTINDLRTSYRIPAGLELRDRRWQIVHLSTH